jgi:hypothetical protein
VLLVGYCIVHSAWIHFLFHSSQFIVTSNLVPSANIISFARCVKASSWVRLPWSCTDPTSLVRYVICRYLRRETSRMPPTTTSQVEERTYQYRGTPLPVQVGLVDSKIVYTRPSGNLHLRLTFKLIRRPPVLHCWLLSPSNVVTMPSFKETISASRPNLKSYEELCTYSSIPTLTY